MLHRNPQGMNDNERRDFQAVLQPWGIKSADSASLCGRIVQIFSQIPQFRTMGVFLKIPLPVGSLAQMYASPNRKNPLLGKHMIYHFAGKMNDKAAIEVVWLDSSN
jgi:hypothetical protein